MPIDDLTALGQKMREARKGKSLTQQELSDLSHVSVKQIAKIEKGQMNPSFLILKALAKVLPISLDYQRHLHAGQLNIRRHQVHALRVAQNPLAGADRLIGQDAAHCVREGKGQLIRLGIAQADGQPPLRVPVNEKHFLSRLRQSYP